MVLHTAYGSKGTDGALNPAYPSGGGTSSELGPAYPKDNIQDPVSKPVYSASTSNRVYSASTANPVFSGEA